MAGEFANVNEFFLVHNTKHLSVPRSSACLLFRFHSQTLSGTFIYFDLRGALGECSISYQFMP